LTDSLVGIRPTVKFCNLQRGRVLLQCGLSTTKPVSHLFYFQFEVGISGAGWVARNKRCAYATGKGGPSNSMPWARHNTGSCGGMALALVTSRKKASMLPAGINVIRILPLV